MNRSFRPPSAVVYRRIILDWSGTVADDLPAVAEAADAVLRAAGVPPLGLEGFRREFELPFMNFYRRFVPGLSREEIDAVYFRRFRSLEDRIEPLPHAADFLEFCGKTGRRVAVLTSVDRTSFLRQCERFGFTDFFEAIETGVEDKRTILPRLVERLGWDPQDCLMVGDMPHDIDAGRAAGTATCAVLSGYGTAEVLAGSGPDLLLENLCELRAFLVERDARWDQPVLTVGALVRNPEGRWLIVRTWKWKGRWGIPGGKVRRGETMEEALLREIYEETGLRIDSIRKVLEMESIDPPEFHRPAHMILVNYTATCDGAEVRLNDEAGEFRWVSPGEALEMELNEPTRRLFREVFDDGS